MPDTRPLRDGRNNRFQGITAGARGDVVSSGVDVGGGGRWLGAPKRGQQRVRQQYDASTGRAKRGQQRVRQQYDASTGRV